MTLLVMKFLVIFTNDFIGDEIFVGLWNLICTIIIYIQSLVVVTRALENVNLETCLDAFTKLEE